MAERARQRLQRQMTAPLVSVLIPCWNAERTIGETLESVLAQTWPNVEIIVVDDGSTDGSAGVVERFASLGVRLFRQANRGQTAALNACLEHARGEFIQYLDADDVIDPRARSSRQMWRLARARPGCVASAEWGRLCGSIGTTRLDPEPVRRGLSTQLDWLALSRAEGLGMMRPALWLIPTRPSFESAGPCGTRRSNSRGRRCRIFHAGACLTAERVLFVSWGSVATTVRLCQAVSPAANLPRLGPRSFA